MWKGKELSLRLKSKILFNINYKYERNNKISKFLGVNDLRRSWYTNLALLNRRSQSFVVAGTQSESKYKSEYYKIKY